MTGSWIERRIQSTKFAIKHSAEFLIEGKIQTAKFDRSTKLIMSKY